MEKDPENEGGEIAEILRILPEDLAARSAKVLSRLHGRSAQLQAVCEIRAAWVDGGPEACRQKICKVAEIATAMHGGFPCHGRRERPGSHSTRKREWRRAQARRH